MPRAFPFSQDFARSKVLRAMSGPVRGVNLSLRMMWRQAANFAKQGRLVWCSGRFVMSPDALNSLLSLCIGFALAGALASGYQALVSRPAGLWLPAVVVGGQT